MSPPPAVVAITPAHNEAAHIGALVESMAQQTTRPRLWVIVDDGSDDETAATARRTAEELGLDNVVVEVRRRSAGRSFSAKAAAVAVGWEIARAESADVVAVVDADVVLPPDFLTTVLDRFASDPSLGVTGGIYAHPVGNHEIIEFPPPHHVPGPTQTFRREVWEAIGGYRSLPHGGIDTAANVDARRAGWTTRSIPELVVRHSRRMGTGGGTNILVAEYRKGRQDHDLANLPLFELGKLARRAIKPPYLIGAIARFAGYVRGAVARNRPVSADFVRFVRREQRARLRALVRRNSR